MKREEAFYHKVMLMTGFDDGYDEWLNQHLESENPLSDIVLELVCCGSDVRKTISVLHNFCVGQIVDEAVVCDKVRNYFRDAYYTSRMSKEEISSAMYSVTQNVSDLADMDIHIWGSMYYMIDFLSNAKVGIISQESFDRVFFSYLDKGIPFDFDKIWNQQKRVSIIDYIKRILKGKHLDEF